MKKEFLLIVLSILLFVSFSELILRVLIYPSYSSENFFGSHTDENKVISKIIPFNVIENMDKEIVLNNVGFRGDDFKLDESKIAIIGDSFTYGYGLDIEETYPDILHEITGYEIYNFGFYGTNILDIFWIYETKVKGVHPDMTLYGYFPNDPHFRPHNLDPEFCNIFNQDSRFYNFIKIRLDNTGKKLESAIQNNGTIDFTKIVDKNYYGWTCLEEVFDELSGENIIVFYIPLSYTESDDDLFMQDQLYEVLSKRNIRYIPDFSQKFWDKTKGYSHEDLIQQEGAHYTSFANRFIAEIISDYLKNEIEYNNTN